MHSEMKVGALRDPPQGTAGGDIPAGTGGETHKEQRLGPSRTSRSLGTNPDITKGGKLRLGLDDLDPIFFSLVLFFSSTSS